LPCILAHEVILHKSPLYFSGNGNKNRCKRKGCNSTILPGELGIREGALLSIEEREEGILLRPKRAKKRKIEDFFGLEVERTGEPEWATPEEINNY
jgi:hypothetical protein